MTKENWRNPPRQIEEPRFTSTVLHTLGQAIFDAVANPNENGKIICAICGMPATLEIDMVADENGKLVHEDCYLARVVN
ncbi:MAG: hypothetical protein WCC37_09375 [Candidatus Sulfotelmatobacter sp.]